MATTTIINEGSQAYAPCIFYIERNTATADDAQITITTHPSEQRYSYLKTIKGISTQVNVADYAKAFLNTTPYIASSFPEYKDTKELGRVVQISLVADEIISSTLIGEGWDNGNPLLRTALRKRLIAPGMTDEFEVRADNAVSVIINSGKVQTINIPSSKTTNANVVCIEVPPHLRAGDTFFVLVGSERIDYTIVHGGTQLRWINKYGAIDSWVWESEQSEEVSTTKTRIYTADGYTTLNTEAEEEITLRSRVVDKDTAREVASVLYALRVWRIDYEKEGGAIEQVDVANTEGTVSSADSLTQIGVRIRRRKRVL